MPLPDAPSSADTVAASGARGGPDLPYGYLLVPVSAGQKDSPLRLCALARATPDPVAGHLVLLRDTVDAKVYLGCVADAGGRVREWVELWVQSLDGVENSVPASRQALSNAVLDRRWVNHVRAFEKLDGDTLLLTGWETRHPAPAFVDMPAGEALHPGQDAGQSEGGPWHLCTDDALLTAKGLPAYGTSLHRYLHRPALGADSPFAPVTFDAPAGAGTVPMDQVAGDPKRFVPFNPGGGLMLVRRYSPIGYEAFVDLLGGGPWEGLLHGRSAVELDATVAALKETDSQLHSAGGRLFLGKQGRKGRLVETFHLKLRALADAVAAVRGMVRDVGRPMLNLAADSFQIKLGDVGGALPFLWTARVLLADPGDAVELPIKTSDAQYYLPGLAAGPSIYRPDSANGFIQGRGTLRIRKALPDVGGAVVLEGTFVTQERMSPARQDLIWLRVNLAGRRVDLYGRLEKEAALAASEWRVRTVAQRLPEPVAAALKSAEGVPVPNVAFEMIPLLTTPCDLYALAVLAVRTLLVNGSTTLPVALDEVSSLARQLAADYPIEAGEPPSLGARVRAVFDADPRWVDSLGPHRLTFEATTPQEAFDLIPSDLWWDALAAIVRMLPGVGPDSTAKDYGDARMAGLQKVFERAEADFDSLLVRSRSLIVIDWQYNRKVHSVIRRYMTGISGGPPAKADAAKADAAKADAAKPQPARPAAPVAPGQGVRPGASQGTAQGPNPGAVPRGSAPAPQPGAAPPPRGPIGRR